MKLPKPSPEGIKMALSRLGINHEPATPSVVFIGDSPSDLETSLRANIQFILIKEDTSSFEFPQIPSNVRVVSGVSDLIVYCN